MIRRDQAQRSVLVVVFTCLALAPTLRGADFLRGDVDRSGRIEITDPIRILARTFLGGPSFTCLDAADANDSSEIDLSDAIYLLTFLFQGGTAPPAPFPLPGADPTADVLDCGESLSWIHRWNQIAIDSSGLDHKPVAEGENRVGPHQPGPGRASRAMAIVHIAMFEAVNAITGGYHSYMGMVSAPPGASMHAAIAKAGHDTLVALFPSHAPRLDVLLAEDLAQIEDGPAETDGVALGANAAQTILGMRADDGSDHPEPKVNIDYIPAEGPGVWRQDPISLHPLALGARWAEVRPFAMTSADQFRCPPFPALDSPELAASYNEVKRLGGDGTNTPTERDAHDTETGIYWAYDGTPSLCAPPRLYNQIASQIAEQMGSSVLETARLLALANVAMADATLGVWESKYHYAIARPVTAIREAAAYNNPELTADPAFSPLGAPASNLTGPNFTPPFPAYPSGHAGMGGALFQTLRRFYGTDDIHFTFVSDELNGVTRDNQGNVRPLVSRTYSNLSTPEEENGQSRIYLGIHWSYDKNEGIALGRRVADLVVDSMFLPE